jgi:cation diffusion facilitator family transporter
MRASSQPADRKHPYGHQKFEMLAVFVLAVLLAAIGLEIATRAFIPPEQPPASTPWALGLMFVVLAANISIALWQRYWASKLESSILMADASHTLADVGTTVVVIAGWQLSLRGYPWLDSACALAVAAMIFYLAYGLFRDAVPVLVDEVAIEPEELLASVRSVPGVLGVPRVRSRWIGAERAVDVIVTVGAKLTTVESHAIADAIEAALERDFGVIDSTVHIEPHLRAD